MEKIILDRAAIMAAPDNKVVPVDVPEWGGRVYVRTMTGAERDALEAAVLATKGKDKAANLQNVRARIAALCLSDETGARLFQDTDIEALGKRSGVALDRVFAAAQKLNRLLPTDLDELVGN